MCQHNLPCSIVLPTACFPEGPSPHFTFCSFWRRRPRLEAVITRPKLMFDRKKQQLIHVIIIFGGYIFLCLLPFNSYIRFFEIKHFELTRFGCIYVYVLYTGSEVLMPLPRGAMGWSVICDCGISWSYSLILYCILRNGKFQSVPALAMQQDLYLTCM